MAGLAVSDKQAADRCFIPFLKLIEAQADDERNFVKKAVNWALRQIGKRSLELNQKAIVTANKISQQDNKTSRWVAKDALRELSSEKQQSRLKNK